MIKNLKVFPRVSWTLTLVFPFSFRKIIKTLNLISRPLISGGFGDLPIQKNTIHWYWILYVKRTLNKPPKRPSMNPKMDPQTNPWRTLKGPPTPKLTPTDPKQIPHVWSHGLWFLQVFSNEKKKINFEVHIFWEGQKILLNFHLTFVLCSASQK